jgi:predicted nucleotidyltransferase
LEKGNKKMGILELIKNKQEMRRLFGEKELKIIEKQLLGVSLTPSEKTRLSRDIRPKFEIILELSNFSKEFELKKAQEIKYLIEEAKEIILSDKESFEIKKIYVFGSFIKNKLRLNSDIDIVVELDKTSITNASKFKMKTQGLLNKKIQLTIFNLLPDKIKSEVLNKGKIIYDRGKN